MFDMLSNLIFTLEILRLNNKENLWSGGEFHCQFLYNLIECEKEYIFKPMTSVILYYK